MHVHPDAIGYLNDLSKEVDEGWFTMICDLAAMSGVSTLDQEMHDILFAIYTNNASYIGIKSPATVAVYDAATTSTDFLEQLSCFTNFKLLGDALELSFKRRISLIFGANGSGKSSLCESLKILAASERPSRPLHNVRTIGATPTGFSYKFRGDATIQLWSPSAGFGPRQTTVKFFDTSIAIKNVGSAVDPGRVIVLTPFKLHVFEWVKALTTEFRDALKKEQQENTVKLIQVLAEIRTDFAKFKGSDLSVIAENKVNTLLPQIKLGEEFTDHKLLSEKRSAATELEKAASEEGLKLLRAEYRELETFLTSLSTLLTSATGMWSLEPANKAKILAKKKIEQEVLAKILIPKDGTLDDLLALLHAASPLCNMDDATGHVCPLCKRGLGDSEVDLFKRYYDLLAGDLEMDIELLKSDIAKAVEFETAVISVDRNAWEKCTTIQPDIQTAAKIGSSLIVANCEVTKEPTDEAKSALELLKTSAEEWTVQLGAKKNAIDVAAKGREELVEQLSTLQGEIEPLEYACAISERLKKLCDAQQMVDNSKFWIKNLPAFTQVLKKITEKAKNAHEDLVVIDFEARLDAEYKALAEKDMAAFGVMLARKGNDAAVTVLPQIGGKDIQGVLSEGELRVHALALFFAELETCMHSVFVFDDPISSFDYNYIWNYCARLRDFTLKYPDRQIIVLTHNWEFFVQLQTTLNQASLDSHLSVQVLESCAVVADYSEKIEDLKKDIEIMLAAAGEPLKSKKEETAGKMRRLIEAVVNTHVFNNQRHQYKQKSQAISTFQTFTKIVPLLPQEATILRDLYAKLSITEHDDPRTAYVNTDKAMFKTRYDQIIAIETAIKIRIP